MRILVIDDEPQLRRALRVGLERDGHEAVLAASGEEGLDLAATRYPDAVVLDLAMPGIDGFEVCRQLREWYEGPIIVLSARESPGDKIAALDLGADDYLIKPFHYEELLARIRAVLRRAREDREPKLPQVSAGSLQVDFARRRVTVDGRELHLSPTEYELLRYLILHPDRVLTHRQLLTKVWGPEYADDSATLRVHISKLRNKIEPEPARPRFLHTEPRIGYRFQVKE